MDTSMARPQIQIEAIRTAVMDGKLDTIGIRHTLLREIALELDKPFGEVNMDYVNACQDFLTRLESNRASAIISHYNENLEVIHRKTTKRINFSVAIGMLRPIAALCLIFIVLFSGLLFPSERIITSQSPDNEQYLVQGVVDPIGSLSQANANNMQTQLGSYVTTDWSYIISLLGYEPRVPIWIPDGWNLKTYKVDFIETFARFSATYENQDFDRYLVFDSIYFYDIEDLHAEIEQNSAGVQTPIGNMASVYITNNIDDAVAVWYEGHMRFILTGPVSGEDLICCIKSMYSSE